MSLERYPFSCDGFSKGDVISVSFIERAYGVSHGTDLYRFALLDAKDFIKREFAAREPSEVVEVRERRGELYILVTDEASEYTRSLFDNSRRRMTDAFDRKAALPRAEMCDSVRVRHDLDLTQQGKMIQAMRQAGRGVRTKRERPTPVRELPEPHDDDSGD